MKIPLNSKTYKIYNKKFNYRDKHKEKIVYAIHHQKLIYKKNVSNIKHQTINLHINTMNRLTQNYNTTKQPDVIPQEKISPSLKTLHNS